MTSAVKIIDQELAQFGWVESIATNSISDFKSPKVDVLEHKPDKKKSDLLDTFICHLIFYVIFCYSLFIYVVYDLGFGLLVANTIKSLFKLSKDTEFPSLIQKYSN